MKLETYEKINEISFYLMIIIFFLSYSIPTSIGISKLIFGHYLEAAGWIIPAGLLFILFFLEIIYDNVWYWIERLLTFIYRIFSKSEN